jgi:lysine 6-dehydrogenase
MKKTYAVLGAGMQGTAAAYDLARFADPAKIVLADAHLEQASKSAARVNGLANANMCEPRALDALNPDELCELLTGVDVVLSCVPFWMHPKIAAVAIRTKTSMVDLGGNTSVTWETLALDDAARSAGVTLIPDTGLAPGLVNSVGMFLVDSFDEPESVQLYCGVLPQHPQPPFGYKLTFNVEGLVTEYDHQAVALRNGNIELIDTLSELETVEIQGLGQMEAFTTSGGTSTAPYTLQGRVRNYAYKTLRFPGHCDKMRVFKDSGFWSLDPVDVKGCSVRPVDAFCKVFGDKLAKIQDLDQCIVRGVGVGSNGGKKFRRQADLRVMQDEHTGFTAMEQTTGYSIAIHAIAIANGGLPSGAVRYENALSGKFYLEELAKRGISAAISEAEI